MRKALCATILLVLAWTSVAGAQVLPDTYSPDFLTFLRSLFAFEETGTKEATGHNWVLWTEGNKIGYVHGFLKAVDIVGAYAVNYASRHGLLMEWILPATYLRFRVGAYVLELDALYSEPGNRDIWLIHAMYIANERLNGREVDLSEWRKKAAP